MALVHNFHFNGSEDPEGVLMRFSLRLASLALGLLLTDQNAPAAEVYTESSPTASGIAYSILFDGVGAGNFNTFSVRILPNASATFLNPGGGTISDLPGIDKTFINPEYDGPIVTGGYAMPFKLTTAHEVSFDVGRIGAYVDTAQPLFLSNVVLPTNATGTASISLHDTGVEIFSQTIAFGVPEPATLAMTTMGLIGLVLRRRNG